jgi:hypothetical protein
MSAFHIRSHSTVDCANSGFEEATQTAANDRFGSSIHRRFRVRISSVCEHRDRLASLFGWTWTRRPVTGQWQVRSDSTAEPIKAHRNAILKSADTTWLLATPACEAVSPTIPLNLMCSLTTTFLAHASSF